MTGDQALGELLDVSEDVVAAVILDAGGEPVASTAAEDETRAAAEIALGMLAYAGALRTGASAGRLEAVTSDGHLFAVTDEGGTIVAATGRDPVAGLVYHDLRATLRKLRRRSRKKANAPS